MNEDDSSLTRLVENTFSQWESVLDQYRFSLQAHEVGIIKSVSSGIATVSGLFGARLDELIEFPNGLLGIAFNLDAEEIGVILLGNSEQVQAGDKVYRLGRILDVPVGEALLGRVVDGLGRPLDDQGDLKTDERWPTERQSRGIMERDPVEVPLQSGIKVIDALIPVGRGQRELIVGDRQIGKTAIAVDTILNQQDHNVICIYCAIGQRGAAVAKVINRLREHQAIDYTVVVVAPGESPPGLKYITPYAATTIGEYFRDQGRDVLIIYDDLTQHAWAYRELSLLLRRPPGREAYPGDIFYIHSRLLERATHLREEFGGGSLTALPIVETQAQNISAYIPTNLISITDGQIYLSPNLFQQGILPAVDVGKSVSRVGGKTQLPAYRRVASDLRLSYSQFQEVEVFARFGTRLDEQTRHTLERGRRVREVLKQKESNSLNPAEQVAILFAVNNGLFDEIPLDQIKVAEAEVQAVMNGELSPMRDSIEAGEKLSDEDLETLSKGLKEATEQLKKENGHD
ncbi:MAG: alternate F1F0 ATPase, F1 subunit alpha [Cyanobacteria bacterium]|jgi:F-type H+-transporting ATPase subunit alpha|nr:alternate F1F0 ATPase, F1 subunit alpha [Cyanobacteria bacterium GSL.Bin21]